MPERIKFDFKDNYKESMNRLELILCCSGWGRPVLNILDERTVLLTQLLHLGAIAVYEEQRPDIRDHSPEITRRAELFGSIMQKRSLSYALLNMAETFPAQEYDAKEIMHYTPFFPELKAYIRCDGLKPEALLDFFERENCEKVIVFPGYQTTDSGWAYYTFMCAAPREELLSVLERARDKRMSAMREALQKAGADTVFPSLDNAE